MVHEDAWTRPARLVTEPGENGLMRFADERVRKPAVQIDLGVGQRDRAFQGLNVMAEKPGNQFAFAQDRLLALIDKTVPERDDGCCP